MLKVAIVIAFALASQLLTFHAQAAKTSAKAKAPAPAPTRAPNSGCSNCEKLRAATSKLDVNRGVMDQTDEVDAAYEVLAAVVNANEKKRLSTELAQAMLDITIPLLKIDPGQVVMDTFEPAFKKNKTLFKELIEKLSSEDRKLVKESLGIKSRENAEGNG